MNRPQQIVNIADRINRNKFITSTDQKNIANQFRRKEKPGVIKDKMYDTFWSEFETQLADKSKVSHPRQRPNQLEKLNQTLNVDINEERRRNSITIDNQESYGVVAGGRDRSSTLV